MNVWSYWHCDACDNIIRGDSRTCPCCGSPIPNNVRYLMPDNPDVIKAQAEHRILIGNPITRTVETYTDNDGIEDKREIYNYVMSGGSDKTHITYNPYEKDDPIYEKFDIFYNKIYNW